MRELPYEFFKKKMVGSFNLNSSGDFLWNKSGDITPYLSYNINKNISQFMTEFDELRFELQEIDCTVRRW